MDKRDSCNYRKASQFREVAGINTVSQRSLSPLVTEKLSFMPMQHYGSVSIRVRIQISSSDLAYINLCILWHVHSTEIWNQCTETEKQDQERVNKNKKILMVHLIYDFCCGDGSNPLHALASTQMTGTSAYGSKRNVKGCCKLSGEVWYRVYAPQ